MVLRTVRIGSPTVRHDAARQIVHPAPGPGRSGENGQIHFGNRKSRVFIYLT